MVVSAGRGFLLLRNLGDHGFGGQHQASDRSRVLQSSARDLGRVDDAGLHQVLVGAGSGVVAEVGLLRFVDLADHNRTLFAGVRDDHAKRLFDRATDDRCTDLLIALEAT